MRRSVTGSRRRGPARVTCTDKSLGTSSCAHHTHRVYTSTRIDRIVSLENITICALLKLISPSES